MGSAWPIALSTPDDNLQDSDLRKVRQSPRLFALSSVARFDPTNVNWTRWQSLDLRTNFYNAMVHEALFVLPAELQRSLLAKPPRRFDGGARARAIDVDFGTPAAVAQQRSESPQKEQRHVSQFHTNKSLEES